MIENQTGMSVIELLRKVIKHWWFITVMLAIGGFTGLSISLNRSPVYEAVSIFSVAIDYTQTGALTDVQEDQVMRNIGYIISSDKVMQATYEGQEDLNCMISREELENQSFLDRQDASWYLRIRHADPFCAMEIVNSWAGTANDILQEGLFHASKVDANNKILTDLTRCLIASPLNNQCGIRDTGGIQEEIDSISKIIVDEKRLSEGLNPALSINLVKKAVLPDDPVQNNRNVLIFSGLLAGLFLSILIFTFISKF